MIIVFALDDSYVIDNAYHNDKKTFGVGYFYKESFGSYPKAGRNEDLFITAHGNEYVIGNLNDDVSISAEELAKHIYKNFLPGGFQGNIYIFSCDSAPKYHKNFKNAFLKLNKGYEGKVFGCQKKVSYPIYHPNHIDWKQA